MKRILLVLPFFLSVTWNLQAQIYMGLGTNYAWQFNTYDSDIPSKTDGSRSFKLGKELEIGYKYKSNVFFASISSLSFKTNDL
jgi:hypothetical protein